MPGQLDEISQAIGRLEGSVESIERYIHGREHDVKDVSAKIDGLGHQIAKDIAKVEARIEAKVDAYIRANDIRVAALEMTGAEGKAAKNVVIWFVQSPLVGWIAAAFMVALAWWKKP